MARTDYAPPVDQLFTYGSALGNLRDWSEYLNLGIGVEQIPQLIQLILDDSLYDIDTTETERSPDQPLEQAEEQAAENAIWAPVHAWRLLGQLQAEAAIDPLLSVLTRWGDIESDWWEWVLEEFPRVFSQIGSATIAPLARYSTDQTQPLEPRCAAIESLAKVGIADPDVRDACVTYLTQHLQNAIDNTPEMNGYLISALLDLKAIESAAVMEQAFQVHAVDESFAGDWDDVQVELGLKTRAEVPRQRFMPREFVPVDRSAPSKPADLVFFDRLHSSKSPRQPSDDQGWSGFSTSKSTPKAKVKQKQQKAARRKNRKKKK